jgi:hypothetical protein
MLLTSPDRAFSEHSKWSSRKIEFVIKTPPANDDTA